MLTQVPTIGPHTHNVAREFGVDLETLSHAQQFTERTLIDLSNRIHGSFPTLDNVDVVVCGSLGRGEASASSDCDFLVIVEAHPEDYALLPTLTALVAQEVKDQGMQPPGSTGLFSDFAIAAELVGRIGLESDSYKNTTRRVLLMTESASLLNSDVRDNLLRHLALRYCSDYSPSAPSSPRRLPRTPRVLVNDLIRYWRIIAVDFAAKRWVEAGHDQLRLIKLRTTRKVLFAGSLAGAFQLELEPEVNDRHEGFDALVNSLCAQMSTSPLERLMSLWDYLDISSRHELGRILKAYVDVLAVLADQSARGLLRGPGNSREAQELRASLHMLGDTIQSGLEQIFFEDGAIKPLTLMYGMF